MKENNAILNYLDDFFALIILYASSESLKTGINCIYPSTFLTGMILAKEPELMAALAAVDISPDVLLTNLREELQGLTEEDEGHSQGYLSSDLYKALRTADLLRTRNHDTHIRPSYIAISFMTSDLRIKSAMEKMLAKPQKLKTYLASHPQFSKNSPSGQTTAQKIQKAVGAYKKDMAPDPENIGKFCRNFTKDASDGKLDPIIGRELEVNQMITALSRRGKNNPILIGDPGVGKTALVELLAQKIANNDVPDHLKGCRIYGLNMGQLVAGTKYRGEFEQRLTNIINEASNKLDIILFIDETHNLVGAGSSGSGGALDASNILKPSLARGEIKCIGATTMDDFKKYFTNDKALIRRFQEVHVDEPSKDMAKQMLIGLKTKLETHHKCSILEEAIDASIELSVRYNPTRFLPDKAIDCLDHACAKLVFSKEKNKVVAYANIADAISEQCKIPVEILLWDNHDKIEKIEQALRDTVVGQSHVIDSIIKVLKNSYTGVRDPHRPVGSFVFGGETGTGKTYMATTLAKLATGNEKSVIRLDMSEYSEAHSISRLIGPPPGYVGFNSSDIWVDKVKRNPYSVILLDEIEKAHPDIAKILLQVMSNGELTDATGAVVNFKNTTLIMTGNFGMNQREKKMGFDSSINLNSEKARLVSYLSGTYGEEFTNRVDDIVVFNPLDDVSKKAIIRKEIDKIKNRLKDNPNIKSINIDDCVFEHLLKILHSEHGKNANLIKRILMKNFEPLLAEGIYVTVQLKKPCNITITCENGVLSALTTEAK